MSSLGRSMQRKGLSLRQELDEIHRKRAADGRAPTRKAFPHESEHGKSKFSKCGPSGELREHPNIDGLYWLKLFATALGEQGLCAENRVDATDWEKTGCVSLHLERVAHAAHGQMATRLVGGKMQRRRLAKGTPMSSGVWETWRVPVGLINNHDIRGMLRLILTPQGSALVLASNLRIRAIDGH